MTDSIAISVDGISKRYEQPSIRGWLGLGGQRPGHWALRDVTFDVHAGETIGLLGPNGAGKTTTLKTIATLIYPTTGRVTAYGRDIFEDSYATRGMMGLVTCDERSFYWRLTGMQNLEFFAALYGLDPPTARVRIGSLLEALDLTAAARRPFHGYSSGMKQKLAIARGLLSEPRILLYDEPTRSLDPVSAQNIRQWVMEMRRRHPDQTHVIATNQLDEAEMLCDRIVVLAHGRLVAQGTIRAIREQWSRNSFERHEITYRGPDLTTDPRLEGRSGLLSLEAVDTHGEWRTIAARTRPDGEVLTELLGGIIAAGGTVRSVSSEVATLEEVFHQVVRTGDATGRDGDVVASGGEAASA
ncbi:MAG: ABC transporter ATP-binding protein [Ectothiorhodospiraceae bacterium]|nr:ABC transporter ATP-binding protein [Ectothiorhodospiraceae bacterium]